jgi:G8 domain
MPSPKGPFDSVRGVLLAATTRQPVSRRIALWAAFALALSGVIILCARRLFPIESSAAAAPNLVSLASPDPCAAPAFDPLEKCIDKITRDVTIGSGSCKNVYIDQSYTARTGNALGKITIQSGGLLELADRTAQLPIAIDTTGIEIDGGGTLQVGNASCPIGTTNPETKFTINFTGSKPNNCGTPNNNPNDACAGWVKGIEVEPKGTLLMHGAKGVTPTGISWTHLSMPAGPEIRYGKNSGIGSPVPDGGNITLQLADDVTKGKGAWQIGDWIVIGSTSFSP